MPVETACRRPWAAVVAAAICLHPAVGAAASSSKQPPLKPDEISGGKSVFIAVSGSRYVFDAAAVAADNPQARNATDQPGNISGIWLAERAPPVPGAPAGPLPGLGGLRTAEGEPAPLQPWAKAKLDERTKAEAEGRPFASTMAACLPQGMPGMALRQPYPIQIIQSPGQVTIIHELMNSHRLIYLDQKLPEDPDPSYMGTSVGHWEGDTLVVTTIGIRDNTTLGGGAPHSDQLRTVERYRRLDYNTLEVEMTLDDPKAFTKPWKMRARNKLLPTAGHPIEYICENQRNPVDDEGRSVADVKK